MKRNFAAKFPRRMSLHELSIVFMDEDAREYCTEATKLLLEPEDQSSQLPAGGLQTLTAIHGPEIVAEAVGKSVSKKTRIYLRSMLDMDRGSIYFSPDFDTICSTEELVTIVCKDAEVPADIGPSWHEAHPLVGRIKLDFMEMSSVVTPRQSCMSVVRMAARIMGCKLKERPAGHTWEQLCAMIIDDAQVRLMNWLFCIALAKVFACLHHILTRIVSCAQDPKYHNTIIVERFKQIPKLGQVQSSSMCMR